MFNKSEKDYLLALLGGDYVNLRTGLEGSRTSDDESFWISKLRENRRLIQKLA